MAVPVLLAAILPVIVLALGFRVISKARDVAWTRGGVWDVLTRAFSLWMRRRRAGRWVPMHDLYRREYYRDPSRREYEQKQSFVHDVVSAAVAMAGVVLFFALYLLSLFNSLSFADLAMLCIEIIFLSFMVLILFKTERDIAKAFRAKKVISEIVERDTSSEGISVFLDAAVADSPMVRDGHTGQESLPPESLEASWKRLNAEREPAFSLEVLSRVREIAQDKKKATRFLQESGFLDEKGSLAAKYRE